MCCCWCLLVMCVCVSESASVFLRLSSHFESYFKRRRSTEEKSTRCATKLRILPPLPRNGAEKNRIVTGGRSYGGPAKEAKRPAVSPSHFTVNVSEVVGAPCYSHQKKSQAVLGMFFSYVTVTVCDFIFLEEEKELHHSPCCVLRIQMCWAHRASCVLLRLSLGARLAASNNMRIQF